MEAKQRKAYDLWKREKSKVQMMTAEEGESDEEAIKRGEDEHLDKDKGEQMVLLDTFRMKFEAEEGENPNPDEPDEGMITKNATKMKTENSKDNTSKTKDEHVMEREQINDMLDDSKQVRFNEQDKAVFSQVHTRLPDETADQFMERMMFEFAMSAIDAAALTEREFGGSDDFITPEPETQILTGALLDETSMFSPKFRQPFSSGKLERDMNGVARFIPFQLKPKSFNADVVRDVPRIVYEFRVGYDFMKETFIVPTKPMTEKLVNRDYTAPESSYVEWDEFEEIKFRNEAMYVNRLLELAPETPNNRDNIRWATIVYDPEHYAFMQGMESYAEQFFTKDLIRIRNLLRYFIRNREIDVEKWFLRNNYLRTKRVFINVAKDNMFLGYLPFREKFAGIIATKVAGLMKLGFYVSDSLKMDIRNILRLSSVASSLKNTILTHMDTSGSDQAMRFWMQYLLGSDLITVKPIWIGELSVLESWGWMFLSHMLDDGAMSEEVQVIGWSRCVSGIAGDGAELLQYTYAEFFSKFSSVLTPQMIRFISSSFRRRGRNGVLPSELRFIGRNGNAASTSMNVANFDIGRLVSEIREVVRSFRNKSDDGRNASRALNIIFKNVRTTRIRQSYSTLNRVYDALNATMYSMNRGDLIPEDEMQVGIPVSGFFVGLLFNVPKDDHIVFDLSNDWFKHNDFNAAVSMARIFYQDFRLEVARTRVGSKRLSVKTVDAILFTRSMMKGMSATLDEVLSQYGTSENRQNDANVKQFLSSTDIDPYLSSMFRSSMNYIRSKPMYFGFVNEWYFGLFEREVDGRGYLSVVDNGKPVLQIIDLSWIIANREKMKTLVKKAKLGVGNLLMRIPMMYSEKVSDVVDRLDYSSDAPLSYQHLAQQEFSLPKYWLMTKDQIRDSATFSYEKLFLNIDTDRFIYDSEDFEVNNIYVPDNMFDSEKGIKVLNQLIRKKFIYQEYSEPKWTSTKPLSIQHFMGRTSSGASDSSVIF